MRLLDLFSCAGGAAVGYHRAGFDVVGVDVRPQPEYPFEFHLGDALEFLRDHGHEFDAIHASPPCQAYSRASLLAEHQGNKRSTVDLVEPTRMALIATGKPFVIENVAGAPLVSPLMLCGSMFGLKVRRHRMFESSVAMFAPGPCRHKEQGRPVGVYGRMGDHVKGVDKQRPERGVIYGGRTASTIAEAQDALGIAWVTRWDSLKEAIPPAYTEWVGRQLALSVHFDRQRVTEAAMAQADAHVIHAAIAALEEA